MERVLEGIAGRGLRSISEITGLKVSGIVALRREEEGWHLCVELVEKESIPRGMDVLGLYSVRLDADGEVLHFERTRLRRRADTGEERGLEAI